MFRNIPLVNRFQIPQLLEYFLCRAVTFFDFAKSSDQGEIDVVLAWK